MYTWCPGSQLFTGGVGSGRARKSEGQWKTDGGQTAKGMNNQNNVKGDAGKNEEQHKYVGKSK